MHVFGWWEEAGVPGENPHMHGENMQTLHREAADGIQTRNPLAVRRQCKPVRNLPKQERTNRLHPLCHVGRLKVENTKTPPTARRCLNEKAK